MGHSTGAINALFTFIFLGRAAGVMCVRTHVHITARGTLAPLPCLRRRWEGAHGTQQALSGRAARARLLSGIAVSLPRENPAPPGYHPHGLEAAHTSSRDNATLGPQLVGSWGTG